MSTHPTRRRRRYAVSAVFVPVAFVVLPGLTSLAVNVGYLCNVRGTLQEAPCAADLAAVSQHRVADRAVAVAQQPATLASTGNGAMLAACDVHIGNWDGKYDLFTAGESRGIRLG